MFVVVLTYTAPIEEVDLALPDHVAWLEAQYERGLFLASGARKPRVGGVIITRPMSQGKLDAILASDPFAVRNLAKHEVIPFSPTKTAPELRQLNEAITR
jgi:uncharacterized protein YciI